MGSCDFSTVSRMLIGSMPIKQYIMYPPQPQLNPAVAAILWHNQHGRAANSGTRRQRGRKRPQRRSWRLSLDKFTLDHLPVSADERDGEEEAQIGEQEPSGIG